VTLPIDLSRPARTPAEQRVLVEAVRDAPSFEQETRYLEWKRTLDLATKEAWAVIAKAVLGFSNRMPDVAAEALDGAAHMFVGVEPGRLDGVASVDDATLHPGVRTYCGPGPRWHSTYVEVDGKAVLLVTVESPQWGDPLHPVRKTFTSPTDREVSVYKGRIFVRHPARTDEAGPADIDLLSTRAARRAGDELHVSVEFAAPAEVGRVDLTSNALDTYIEAERQRLFATMPGPRRRSLDLARAAFDERDVRSAERFREIVESYLRELRPALPEALLKRSVMHDVGLVELNVVNSTDEPFSEVSVELFVPREVRVVGARFDARYTDLPEAPRPYGTETYLRSFVRPADIKRRLAVRNLWLPDVEDAGRESRVRFSRITVPPQGSERLEPIWLLATQNTPASVPVRWEATGAARKRLRGALEVAVSDRCWTPEELLAPSPHESQDDD
jgi:hypothetical protein